MNIKRPWDDLITNADKAAYATAGFGGSGGMGKHPALLIIDMQYRTTGTARVPIAEAMKEFPTSCGDAAWAAADQVKPLLSLFRSKNWPVLYPHVAPKKLYDRGRLTEKVPTMMDIPLRGYEFFGDLAPIEGDILIPKHHPSAFFGTSLASHLVNLGVDTLLMVGCTTSGCIRASVVDGFSYNYHVIVPEDCVYDRGEVSHVVNLFDMSQKYAEVLPANELLKRLREISVSPK
ncbi:MAG: isochorismatase family protein [Advenella sp.]|uniref:Hydrolase n=1 Tax=Advenella kashmirensis TaxID=310575 RepID=A0A356LAI0_9BURK|nr:isochorismatase family protein [Advenella sp. FME57]HBP28006.1 hydrolase [Advenella kashmirensis]